MDLGRLVGRWDSAAFAVTALALGLSGCDGSGNHGARDRVASSRGTQRPPAPAHRPGSAQARQQVPSPSSLTSARLHTAIKRAFDAARSQASQAPPITGEHGTQARFDSVIAMLPIRLPPLPIQQYMTNRGSHRVVIRPTEHDYYCLPLGRRAAVIAAYSKEATALFKGRGIDGVSFVVDALRATGDVHPLARARGSSVSLTVLGRRRRSC
jgi:hypothetical protein